MVCLFYFHEKPMSKQREHAMSQIGHAETKTAKLSTIHSNYTDDGSSKSIRHNGNTRLAISHRGKNS